MRIEKFTNLYRDVTKEGTKIPQEKYCLTGQFPIVDQGQRVIAGWWNDDAGIFKNVPAIIFGDHTRAIKYMEQPFFIGADGVKILRPTNIKDNPKYLYYALQAAKIPNLGYSRHFKVVKELQICIYSRDEQNEIVRVLEKIDYLIEQRYAETTYLDQLVKSRFIELFGDPETNPKGWTRQRLDQICENLDSRRVPITSTNRKAGNYPYYGASGIVDYVKDYIFDEDILLISEDGANLVMRSTPIAFSVSGKVWVNNHAHVVRFESKATQKYIEICFALTDISGSITGTAQPKLNQAKLNAMMFCVPPIELQEQFATFVEQTDKSKLAAQKGLQELEILKKSLMQQYFG